jgi:hypothetical protein
VKISPEAQQLAYKCGVSALAPFFERMFNLEKRVQELERAQQAPHMRKLEKR